jgi:hypothetical protein
MTVEKLKLLHDQRPFQPFTIHMADGTSVTVKHPEFLLRTVGGRTIWVHSGKGDEAQIIDLLLVTKLSTGARNGNGKHRRIEHN